VSGAQRVQVTLHQPATGDALGQFLTGDSGQTMEARIVGTASEIDLALLKVDAKGLRAMPFADYHKIRQGELVFALGSPQGLSNSVTMGVVSAVARQTDPDSPTLYIQTDAPINPGNSGGPLVDVNGDVVGLNTFILSQSGGSQGLGFAIPSVVITSAIPQFRRYGRLHRGTVGIGVQAITPQLADGLDLPRSSGVIVSDVVPDSPADVAGVEVQDIITAVNGRSVDSVPVLMLALGTRTIGDTVTLVLVRGDRTLSVSAPVAERPPSIEELSERADPGKNAVPALGIIGFDLDDSTRKLLADLRIPSGVLVTARRQESDADSPLMAGDVIHAVDSFAVRSLDGLRVLLDGLASGSPIVLEIERDHHLMFVTMVVY
jgi:serine protease Do